MCNTKIVKKRTYKIGSMILFCLKKCFLPCGIMGDFHHVWKILGHMFSDMCGIMGPNFEPKQDVFLGHFQK